MKLHGIAILPLIVASPALAHTAPVPATVDLETVLRLAQRDNPRVAVEEQQIAGAQADRITASARPNPSISYNGSYQPGELTNFSTRLAHEATVQVPLLLGGKRRARIEAANRHIDAARSNVAATKVEFMRDAGASFLTLLVAQQTVEKRHAALAELDRLRAIVAGRRASGVASDYDLIRVDVEIEAARADLADAEVDQVSAQGDLANALGYADWHPQAIGSLDTLASMSATSARDIDDLPSVASALADQRAAQADVVTARRERFPEVSASGGRFWTSQPFGPTYSLGVTVEIPLFDKRNGAVRKAETEARAAEFRTTLARAKAQTDIERYEAQVRIRAQALQTFNQRIGDKLPALGRMAEDSYRLNGGSIVELIEATRSRFDNELTRTQLAGKLAEAMLLRDLARGDRLEARP